jgi:lipopolysaccharide transport system permease protein
LNHYNSDEEIWDLEIKPRYSLFNLNLKEVWHYRDLMMLFVRRDFVAQYKQTILGPIWFFIQPVLTTIMFVIVFGNIAQISTDGLPKILFYLSGITIWNYFADVLVQTSNTFVGNAAIFGKVYFPRLTLPFSKAISGLIKFAIQFFLFLLVFFYYSIFRSAEISPDIVSIIWITPILLLIMAGLGLGCGLVLSALTTKYRDMSFLVAFGVQLAMYATPVIYPLSRLSEKYRVIAQINPMAPVVEAFRKIYLGTGVLTFSGLLYSAVFAVVLVFLGVVLFNKVEKTFMDTV